MRELGELERHQAEIAKRNTRVVVVSLDDAEAAKKTQADFPHLVVVSDANRGLSQVADVLHPKSNPLSGGPTAAPGTLLIDRQGTVRWEFRPTRYLTRLSADELLAAIDQHLVADR
ncbi:MAG TPA: redoxin domain-containing protein [Gemmataceae bacterium]|nr:redoxin domain-containing protein [Gemmataceae bacterium]